MMSASTLLITQCRACGMDLKFPAGVDEVTCEYCDRPNARPVSVFQTGHCRHGWL